MYFAKIAEMRFQKLDVLSQAVITGIQEFLC